MVSFHFQDMQDSYKVQAPVTQTYLHNQMGPQPEGVFLFKFAPPLTHMLH